MTYKLEFKESALKEWRKLGETVRLQLKAKLAERLQAPRVPSAALRGTKDVYKIKLRAAGYRLVYQVNDETVTVCVVAIGKRNKNAIYDLALARLGPGKN